MSSDCALAVEDRFGPIVHGCHTNFDFTLLFEETILFIGPLCLVWILASLRILQLWRRRNIVTPGILLPLKLSAWTLVLFSQVAFLILVTARGGPRTRATLAAGSIGIPAFVALACLSWFEHLRAVRSSSLLTLFLLGTIPMDALRTRTLLQMHNGKGPAISVALLAGTKFCVLLTEIWWKCSLGLEHESCEAPEESHGIIERALMFRMFPIFRTGYRTILQMDHLYKIDGNLAFGRLGPWLASGTSSERIPLTLSRRFFLLHLRDLLDPVFPRLCLLALTFAQPFLVRRAIEHISGPRTENSSREGGALVAAYILVYFGIAVTSSIYEQKASRASSSVRADIALLIYEHSLRLDHVVSSKDSSTTMITADVERVQLGLRRLHDAWGPLASVGIGLWLVKLELGLPSLVTLGLLVGSLVVSGYCGGLAGKYQKLWMEAIEKRLHKTVQTLKGIRSIKQLGASSAISDVLNAERASEIEVSRSFRLQLIAIITTSFISLTMLPALGFGLHVATFHGITSQLLSPEVAFAAMTLFQIISSELSEGAGHTMNLLVAYGSLQRVDKFLASNTWHETRNDLDRAGSSKETGLDTPSVSEKGDEQLAVQLDCVSARWASEGEMVIKEATLNVPLHGLTVIAGPSGSGKSTLLRIILGEVNASKGSVSVRSRHMGYCDQKPWIANVSIRENIVGAFSFDHAHYRFALETCALDQDLQDLSGGDKHVCGLNGASLSGGQRVRVALARATYARAEIMVLDDCLVGLDTDTERRILNNIFGPDGILKTPPMTCIFATSSPKYLTLADHVFSIDPQGYVSQERNSSEDLLAITHPDHVALNGTETPHKKPQSKYEFDSENPSSFKPTDDVAAKYSSSSDAQVYAWYFRHVGRVNFTAFVCLCGLFVVGVIYPQVWLQSWTRKSPVAQRQTLPTFWGVYFGVGSMAWVAFAFACLWLCLRIAVRGASAFHHFLVTTTMNAPLEFFATTDSGITLNRFSQDLQIIDMELPLALVGTTMNVLMLIAQCVVITVQFNYAGFAVLAIAIVVALLHHVYLRSSRRLRLMEIEAKSPVLSLLLESLEGLATMRSLRWTQWYLERGIDAQGRSQVPFHLLQSAQVTLNLSLDTFVAILALVVISIAVGAGSTNGSSLGLALLNIVGLGLSVKGVVHFWTLLEITLGAVARIRDYTLQTPSENHGEAQPEPSWPSAGRILFKDIAVSYSPSLPPAVSNLTLEISPAEKVAICGRTGSGKSTLVNSLLHLVDLSAGTISIDGVDIATLAKEEMRSRFVTLPQETLALSVTAREYARIHGITGDDDIMRGLREIGLWETFEKNGGLDMVVDDDNLSHSQRRLFSVALACLRKGKIVLMDEPTGHLDEHTQTYLRRAVTEVFASSTVVCVTHHLEAVLDFDTVVVMESGVIAERGNPRELLAQADSRFAQLYGSQMAPRLVAAAAAPGERDSSL